MGVAKDLGRGRRCGQIIAGRQIIQLYRQGVQIGGGRKAGGVGLSASLTVNGIVAGPAGGSGRLLGAVQAKDRSIGTGRCRPGLMRQGLMGDGCTARIGPATVGNDGRRGVGGRRKAVSCQSQI